MGEKSGMLGGCIVPHPPLLIPAIGGKDIEMVRSTSEAMKALGVELCKLELDVLVMISPHSPIYRDSFAVKTEGVLEGSFSDFRCPDVRISKKNDLDLARALMKSAEGEGLPLGRMDTPSSRWLAPGRELDHGLLVPLYYLDQYFETPIISLSISELDYNEHFHLGRIARNACEGLGRRAIFVASGDLSHRLIPGAPAGYSPRGEEFDRRIEEIADRGDFDSLYTIDEDLVDQAGECGFRSIHTMWGALKNGALKNKVLSYEGPFGVGYLVSLHLKMD